jgi:hypothetical protein
VVAVSLNENIEDEVDTIKQVPDEFSL